MASAFDVPAGDLINGVAKDLKQRIQQPEFAKWVKSGAHAERAPQNPDWWYVRAASVLYRVFSDGPLGTESLRTYYGGKRRKNRKPPHFRKASGKVIRTCLQALEKDGMIKKLKKGRGITPKGQSYMAKKAKEILPAFEKALQEKAAKRKEFAERAEAAAVKFGQAMEKKAAERKAAEEAKIRAAEREKASAAEGKGAGEGAKAAGTAGAAAVAGKERESKETGEIPKEKAPRAVKESREKADAKKGAGGEGAKHPEKKEKPAVKK